jgi:uncharacterized membrane protein YhaH (DUF805 family)
MRARRTPWHYYVVAIVIGLVAGIGLAFFGKDSSVTVLGASWIVPVLLGVLGILVLVLSWTVRRYAKGELKDIDPRRAFNTLVLAKSLGVAGAGLAGWYVGQLLVVIPLADSPYYSEIILECSIAAGAALFDVAAGVIGEWWCQLPPNEGPENPKVKQRKRMAGTATNQSSQKIEAPKSSK